MYIIIIIIIIIWLVHSAESLELRRLKLDLTMMYKISHSIVAIDDSLFSFTINSQTRGKFKVNCYN